MVIFTMLFVGYVYLLLFHEIGLNFQKWFVYPFVTWAFFCMSLPGCGNEIKIPDKIEATGTVTIDDKTSGTQSPGGNAGNISGVGECESSPLRGKWVTYYSDASSQHWKFNADCSVKMAQCGQINTLVDPVLEDTGELVMEVHTESQNKKKHCFDIGKIKCEYGVVSKYSFSMLCGEWTEERMFYQVVSDEE